MQSKPRSKPCEYLICLGPLEGKRKSIDYIKQQLKSQKLHIVEEEFNNECYLTVSAASDHVIAAKAEELEVTKMLKNSTIATEFKVGNRSAFQTVDNNGRIFTLSEEMWILYRIIQSTDFSEDALITNKKGRSNNFLTYLKTCKPPLVVEDYPLHCQEEKKAVIAMLKSSILPWNTIDLDTITGYFGEEVGFYFAWISFYSRFICIPMFVGLSLYWMRPKDSSVDTDAYLPLYSIFMAVWGVLFLVFWQRQSATHGYNWNTYNLSLLKECNPEFHGIYQRDPVTHELTLHYPQWKRRLWYALSFLLMIPLLFVGVLVMMLSLNLNGYVKDTNSPIYVARLTKYAKPGGIFAPDSPYYGWLIPTIAHSVMVSIINRVYSTVAEHCTNLENHRSITEWKNSIVDCQEGVF